MSNTITITKEEYRHLLAIAHENELCTDAYPEEFDELIIRSEKASHLESIAKYGERLAREYPDANTEGEG